MSNTKYLKQNQQNLNSMDFKKSDARDGKSIPRQWGLTLFYILAIVIFFLVIQIVIIGMSQWTFGTNGFTRVIQMFAGPISLGVLGMIIASTYELYGVNPAGNKAVATFNMFFAEKLADGGTRFTIYTAGFALKWPWERKLSEEIELERDMTHGLVEFKVTIAGSTLEIKMKLSYKPHPSYLSAYLGNIGDHNTLIEQVVSTGQSLTEEIASKYSNAELVRQSPSALALAVRQRLQKEEANKFGFKLTALSYPDCDYSKEVRDAMDTQRVRDIATEMIADLIINQNMGPSDASRTAMLLLKVPNVSQTDYGLRIEAPTDLIQLINAIGTDAIRAILLAHSESKKTTSTKSTRTPRNK